MWFFFSLLAGFFFATNRLIVRLVLTKNIKPMAFGAVHEVLAGLLLLPFALFHISLPQSPHIWFALILGVFFIFLCDLFAFLSLKHIEASIYQIIGQLRHIIVLIGASFLFVEAISPSKIISIFLIILGVTIAMIGKSKITLNKGTIYAFLSTVFISIAFLFIKVTTVEVSPIFSASLSLLVSGVLIYLLLLIKKERPAKLIPHEQRNLFIAASVIFALFEFTLFTALAIGEASKVTPVSQSSMVFTIIGGYIFLKERQQMKQKIIGSILIVLGIVCLYLI